MSYPTLSSLQLVLAHMKILFITPETPATGGGGIATYIRHASDAFLSQGHDVFTFSWVHRDDKDLFLKARRTSDRERMVFFYGRDVWRRFPNGPYQVGLSYFLLPHIKAYVEEIRPDVIETTDFRGPLYAYLAERRAGRLREIESIPVVGFNHGLSRLLYSKNGVLPKPHVQPELAAERQSMRWCDLVFVPSHAALRSFTYQVGHRENVFVVNEPFPGHSFASASFRPAPRLYHLGRLSFSKGIDHAIHFANVITHLYPIERVTFIGKQEWLPFRTTNAEEYLTNRAEPSLKSLLRFPGQVSQEDFAGLFRQGGYSMNFSEQETFNYAFVEMLGHGLFPFTKAETAMEEFLPEELRHLALPSDFDLRGLPKLCEEIDRFGKEYHERITAHVQQVTDPVRYVSRYEELLAARNDTSFVSRAETGDTFSGEDITILMATYNNAALIKESVASIQSQDVQPARTIIIDDGSHSRSALDTLHELSGLPGVEVIRSAQNEGLCAARVKALEHARTPLTVFLDSDDLLSQDYLKKTLSAMNASAIRPDAVLTWRQNFGVSDELLINDLGGDHYHQIRNDFRMTALIRTAVLKQVGFSSAMRNGEADDWLFWLDFHRLGHQSVMVGEPLFLYRFAEGSMSWPWSEGQAALTGVEIAAMLSRARVELSEQAFEDLVSERLWHTLSEPSGTRAEVGGDTFIALYQWAVALRQTRPKLFALLQGVVRPLARSLGRP